MLGEPKNQFSLTHPASSTGRRSKSKFLSVKLYTPLTELGIILQLMDQFQLTRNIPTFGNSGVLTREIAIMPEE
jgi:hypothetical protein